MEQYVVVECPLCQRQRLYPGGEAAADRLVQGLGAHIFTDHPTIPPGEAEEYLEDALDAAAVTETEPVANPDRWDHHLDLS